MKSACRFIKYILIVISVITIPFFSVSVKADDTSYKPENGIVEIYSGISDANDNFYKIKSCSGFVVSNTESSCYIVTTYKGIEITSNEKNECISKNNLSTDTYGINETIKVVVNGDVEANLTKINKSKKQNFAILQSESVINEKKELKLGNSVEEKETVYSLGFSNNEDTPTQFDAGDVTKNEGNVENPSVDLSNGTYIKHSATFDDGCSGGPLVNQDGYVIGLNDSSIASGEYYALGIESVKKILKNYNISYSSYDFDQNYSQYTELYDKCKLLCESGNYTSESVEVLETALSEVQNAINENPSNEDVEAAIKTLKEAKSQLIEKTPTIRIIIFVLAGVLVTLLIWLAFLMIRNYKNTHPPKSKAKAEQQDDEPNGQGNQQINQKQYYSAVPQKVLKNSALLKKPESNISVKIEKPVFTLGSMIEEVDYTVNNKAVSRKHATIRLIDNHYYIFDENSVNGTYVNDVMVEEEGKRLKNNDIIALANEQFIFKENMDIGGG